MLLAIIEAKFPRKINVASLADLTPISSAPPPWAGLSLPFLTV